MFCGVGNRGVEHQADNRLAADISDADAYTGRIESNTAANWGIKVALEGKC
jgi:hypothetical protein